MWSQTVTTLADLYAVEPRVLMQAVKRNRERFPADFMFQLAKQEFNRLKSQIVISSWVLLPNMGVVPVNVAWRGVLEGCKYDCQKNSPH